MKPYRFSTPDNNHPELLLENLPLSKRRGWSKFLGWSFMTLIVSYVELAEPYKIDEGVRGPMFFISIVACVIFTTLTLREYFKQKRQVTNRSHQIDFQDLPNHRADSSSSGLSLVVVVGKWLATMIVLVIIITILLTNQGLINFTRQYLDNFAVTIILVTFAIILLVAIIWFILRTAKPNEGSALQDFASRNGFSLIKKPETPLVPWIEQIFSQNKEDITVEWVIKGQYRSTPFTMALIWDTRLTASVYVLELDIPNPPYSNTAELMSQLAEIDTVISDYQPAEGIVLLSSASLGTSRYSFMRLFLNFDVIIDLTSKSMPSSEGLIDNRSHE